MHAFKQMLAKYYKSQRDMQPSTSYTKNPEAKIVEDMTHNHTMHRYENLIDGTGLHIGLPTQEQYDNMDNTEFPSKPTAAQYSQVGNLPLPTAPEA